MNRIKKIFILVHLVLWIMLSALLVLQLETDGSSYWQRLFVGVILTCIYVFYSHFYLLTNYSDKKKNKVYLFGLAGIVLTGPLPFVFIHPGGLENLEQFWEFYLMTLITVVPLFIFLSWLARVTENLVLNTIRKEQLKKQAVQAELYYLKSQINPHFLFNTLNNIHTLVYKKVDTAPDAVLRLSSLMRYMIYESNAPTVPLLREITYLEDYISLQQLRYQKAPIVDLKILGDINSCLIAPLLFIHFIENAYKHSPARLEPGDIQVKVEVKENTLIFRCQNPLVTIQGNDLEEPGGIGLPNIRKRLQLLYPDTHDLEISSESTRFEVVLKIHNLHLQLHERKDHLLYH